MTDSNLPPPPQLAGIAGGKPLALFLDFDGTLVDIAATPDAIEVPEDLLARLQSLSARLDGRLALVSGRSIEDLESHVGAIPLACAGSHGSDCRAAGGGTVGNPPRDLAHDIREAIAEFAAEHGFSLEEKTHGVALHYRADPSLEERGVKFAEELAGDRGIVVKRGKCVIEFVADEASKASAVRAFMAEDPFAGAFPVFVGDDVTDEDGMRAASELGGVGIAVGERASENARFALASPAAVHHWLQL